ncbi:Glycine-rich RNA-binding protein RZ1A [Histomonas meleagridis]|uniref:Glycine-rich RNA-binding protein RZ1A n=1 Tax=Histomonas meleagridis TaxID=135588 RepID=UPI00355A930E|nr:Glycine-rich RNA-binding protein RZ1A [Histomonas meleagridis]KAH0796723.1 Glycine-rich RNA-binding protein RZ1A [Histomonas meleagridis]
MSSEEATKETPEAQPNEEQQAETTIHIGNLSWNVTEDQLRDAFAEFGNIIETRIPRDNRNRSRGFGFVHFEKEESVQKAIDGMNEKEIDGRAVSVSVSKKRNHDGDRRGGDRYNDRRGDRYGDRRGGDRYGDRRGGYERRGGRGRDDY